MLEYISLPLAFLIAAIAFVVGFMRPPIAHVKTWKDLLRFILFPCGPRYMIEIYGEDYVKVYYDGEFMTTENGLFLSKVDEFQAALPDNLDKYTINISMFEARSLKHGILSPYGLAWRWVVVWYLIMLSMLLLFTNTHMAPPKIEEVVMHGRTYQVIAGPSPVPEWLLRFSEFGLAVVLMWLFFNAFRMFFDPTVSYVCFIARMSINSAPLLIPLPGASSISLSEFRRLLGVPGPQQVVSEYIKKLQIDLKKYAAAFEDLNRILGEVMGVKISLKELASKSAALFLEQVYAKVRTRSRIVTLLSMILVFIVGAAVGYALGLVLQPVSPQEIARALNITLSNTSVVP